MNEKSNPDCPYECDSNGLIKYENKLFWCPNCRLDKALEEEQTRRETRAKINAAYEVGRLNHEGKPYRR